MTDDDQIEALINKHFEPMRWSHKVSPDWDKFEQDFLPQAQVFGAARPVQARSVREFIDRMETVARANLNSFEEHTTRTKILRFGNVAVVLALSEMLENGTDENRDISGYLLVKSEGNWSIAAHAWDQMANDDPVPDVLE